MKREQINAINGRYIKPASLVISPAELREIVRDNKDSGYHRACLQAANTIERLEREKQEATL